MNVFNSFLQFFLSFNKKLLENIQKKLNKRKLFLNNEMTSFNLVKGIMVYSKVEKHENKIKFNVKIECVSIFESFWDKKLRINYE